MTAALSFGFLNLFIPGHNFERLHVFLFNLCSGGTIILIHTEGRNSLSPRTGAFFILSICYALSAFLHQSLYAVSISVAMALIVETIRIRKYSIFPWNFFSPASSVADKFHHASLLCLSMGLVISSLVICNHQYWHLVSSPKLTLDIFFLGFSFPVSLITMSIMFGLMEVSPNRAVTFLKNAGFWTINLGVLFFFLFILLGMVYAELVISFALFTTVMMIFILYLKLGARLQSKAFLTSGMVFLIMTAVTGIVYIILYVFIPAPTDGKLLLKLHALISLYGWNLNGLAVICRYNDFPIQLNSGRLILFHWVIVVALAPLGFYFQGFSVAAVGAYGLFLYIILFTRGAAGLPRGNIARSAA